jgi:hypothetical protein
MVFGSFKVQRDLKIVEKVWFRCIVEWMTQARMRVFASFKSVKSLLRTYKLAENIIIFQFLGL